MRSPLSEGDPCCSRSSTSSFAVSSEPHVVLRTKWTLSSCTQARGEGAAAAGEAPSVAPPRPDPVGGGEPGAAEEPVVLVRGPARDPAPVAPGAREEEVDLQEERSSDPQDHREPNRARSRR